MDKNTTTNFRETLIAQISHAHAVSSRQKQDKKVRRTTMRALHLFASMLPLLAKHAAKLFILKQNIKQLYYIR